MLLAGRAAVNLLRPQRVPGHRANRGGGLIEGVVVAPARTALTPNPLEFDARCSGHAPISFRVGQTPRDLRAGRICG